MKLATSLLAGIAFAALPGIAGNLDTAVMDAKGAPLENAVVWAIPKVAGATRPKREAAIEQIDKQFVPLVSVVQAGSLVRFPNRDEVRHHVYSFSPAKVFEIKLYAGTPAAPVLFDKPGEVVLGCNIHDHMLAYLYVVDTPYFGKSGRDGHVRLDGLPAGDYELHSWHYAQAAPVDAQALSMRGDEPAKAAFAIATRPPPARPGAK